MKKILSLAICSLLVISSCKEPEAEPEWNPSGLYTIDLTVTKRPPAIIEPDTSSIEYKHAFIFGEIFDTTRNLCCYWRLSKHTCPPKYTISNIRIFEFNGFYYIYNGIDSSGGKQISFHIPLTIQGNKLKISNTLDKSKRSFHLYSLHSNMTSTAESWPMWFDLLNFEMDSNSDGTITGSWAIMDKREFCSTSMSNGETKNYNMAEFAELTFTRIGD
jgi:hypothetical protein